MRVDTIKTKVYKLSELSDDAKQTAIDTLRDINVDHSWWECAEEDAKTIGLLMGITIDDIYFSGFWSKGDGACFAGSYAYNKGSVQAVVEYAPKDTELHRIVTELAAHQRKWLYQIRASVKQSGHYNHRFCTQIDVDFESWFGGGDSYSSEVEKAVIELLRDYMHWIYKQLEAEYNHLISDEVVKDTIEANEYEFTVDGEKY